MKDIAQIKTQVFMNPTKIVDLDRDTIIELLRDDEVYYGDAGKQFLSGSFLGKLISEPWNYDRPLKHSSALTIGSYFHTSILEPEKINQFVVVDQSRSSSKEWHIARKDVEMCHNMARKLLANDTIRDLVRGTTEDGVVYEEPGLVDLDGITFKGKADIINHEEKLIVDLKTTSDLDGFGYSAKKYGYTSQAYIYQEMFGYDMVFVVAEKFSNKIGIFECSEEFIEKGKRRLEKATSNYKKYLKGDDFSQHLVKGVL